MKGNVMKYVSEGVGGISSSLAAHSIITIFEAKNAFVRVLAGSCVRLQSFLHLFV